MKKHPLINKKQSPHYDTKDKPAIQQLEEEMSVIEMQGFVYGNIFKYKYRQDHKGQKDSDLEKIETYENYYNVIKMLLNKGYHNHKVADALRLEEIVYAY